MAPALRKLWYGVLALFMLAGVMPVQAAELSVSVASSPVTPSLGHNLTYTITVFPVRNDLNPAIVEDVVLTYPVPNGTSLVSVDSTAGLCTTGTIVECQLGNLDNASATVTLVVLPEQEGTVSSTLNVSGVAVDSGGTPLSVVTNSIPLTTTLSAPPVSADLAVSVTTSPSSGTVGEELLYSFTIAPELSGSGAAQVEDVTFSYALPSTYALASISSSQGFCTEGTVVTCTIGTLASGAAIVDLIVEPGAEGTIESSATINGVSVSAGGLALGNTNNRLTLSTTILPAPKVLLNFTQESYTVAENVGTATLWVSRTDEDPDRTRPVSIEYVTADGSAVAGEDYEAASGVVSWAEGDKEPKRITLTILNDSLTETEEFLTLTLRNPVSATVGETGSTQLNITDDEVPGTLGFSAAEYRVGEQDGLLVVSVLRTNGSDGAVSVDYQTQDGTAIAGEDYTAVSGTLHWESGDMSAKTFQVPVADEQAIEGDERFRVLLTNATGLATLGQAVADVRVLDNVSESQAIAALSAVAQNPTQLEMARVIGTLCESGNASADLQARCVDLLVASGTNPAGVADAMQQWAPEEFAVMGHIGLDAGFRQIRNISGRLMTLRSGAFGVDLTDLGLTIDGAQIPVTSEAEFQLEGKPKPGSQKGGGLPAGSAHAFELDKLGVFINGHVGISERDTTDRESGFDLDDIGITAGVDYRFSDRFILGAALGYGMADASLDESRGSIDADALTLGLYGTFYKPKEYYVDVLYSIGMVDYDSSRRIRYAVGGEQVDQRALGSPDGDERLFGISGGYHFHHGVMTFTPTLRLEMIDLDVDGFEERMSLPDAVGSGLGVAVDSQSVSSTSLGFGLEVAAELDLGGGKALFPQLALEWVYENEDDEREIRGRFLDDAGRERFILTTDERDSQYFNLGLGMSLAMGKGKFAYVNYQTLFGMEHMDSHSIMGGFRMEF